MEAEPPGSQLHLGPARESEVVVGKAKLRSKVTDIEYDAFHFVDAMNDFEGLEEFVGGDASFIDGQVVVAGPAGALYIAADSWVVHFPGKEQEYTTAPDQAVHYMFEVLPSGE